MFVLKKIFINIKNQKFNCFSISLQFVFINIVFIFILTAILKNKSLKEEYDELFKNEDIVIASQKIDLDENNLDLSFNKKSIEELEKKFDYKIDFSYGISSDFFVVVDEDLNIYDNLRVYFVNNSFISNLVKEEKYFNIDEYIYLSEEAIDIINNDKLYKYTDYEEFAYKEFPIKEIFDTNLVLNNEVSSNYKIVDNKDVIKKFIDICDVTIGYKELGQEKPSDENSVDSHEQYSSPDQIIIIPFKYFENNYIFSPENHDNLFLNFAHDKKNINDILEAINLLQKDNEDYFYNISNKNLQILSKIEDTNLTIKLYSYILLILTWILCLFIFSTTYLNINKRKKNIAISLLLGATKKDIFLEFLGEGIIIGILGWFIALLLSIFLFTKIKILFISTTVLLSFLFSIIIIILSSLFPAIKATKIYPLEILNSKNL